MRLTSSNMHHRQTGFPLFLAEAGGAGVIGGGDMELDKHIGHLDPSLLMTPISEHHRHHDDLEVGGGGVGGVGVGSKRGYPSAGPSHVMPEEGALLVSL